MALNYLQRYTHTQDTDLRHRVSIHIAKSAQYVLAGGGPAGGPPLLSNFQIHSRARVAAANPAADLDQFMWLLAWNTEVPVSADITDAQIATVVDSNYAAIWGS